MASQPDRIGNSEIFAIAQLRAQKTDHKPVSVSAGRVLAEMLKMKGEKPRAPWDKMLDAEIEKLAAIKDSTNVASLNYEGLERAKLNAYVWADEIVQQKAPASKPPNPQPKRPK